MRAGTLNPRVLEAQQHVGLHEARDLAEKSVLAQDRAAQPRMLFRPDGGVDGAGVADGQQDERSWSQRRMRGCVGRVEHQSVDRIELQLQFRPRDLRRLDDRFLHWRRSAITEMSLIDQHLRFLNEQRPAADAVLSSRRLKVTYKRGGDGTLNVYIGSGSGAPAAALPGTNLNTATQWDRVVVTDGRFSSAGVFSAALMARKSGLRNSRHSVITTSASAPSTVPPATVCLTKLKPPAATTKPPPTRSIPLPARFWSRPM